MLCDCECSGGIYQLSEGFQSFALPNNWSVDNPDEIKRGDKFKLRLTVVVRSLLKILYALPMDSTMI